MCFHILLPFITFIDLIHLSLPNGWEPLLGAILM